MLDRKSRAWNLLAIPMLLGVATSALAQDEKKPQVFTQKPAVAESRTKLEVAETKPKPKPQKSKPSNLAGGPTVQWIWANPTPANDRYDFRTEFQGGCKSAVLIATCDNNMTVYLNGKQVAASTDWQAPVIVDITKSIKEGNNQLLVKASNAGGPAGLALKLVMTMPNGKRQFVVTNKNWKISKGDKSIQIAALGKMGIGPWGNVFQKKPSAVQEATRNVFNVLPGFQVERLFTVPKNELGSWVSIAFDDKGRLIASDQGGKGLFRVTPPPIGSDAETKVEKLDINITSAHGMLYAFNSLYISVNGGPGSGFYRARDTNGNDQYDEVKKLKPLRGGGEHGPHSIRLSPDGKSLYVIAGNHTDLPANFTSSRIPPIWQEDLLLPRQWDARGHARGKLAPGGWICKTDPDGETWEVFSIGYRNPFDMDFNADGELFAYDADMEWDMGTPWYRPTRVVHATSGSEFGWRSGTGKWATYYVDSLPPAVETGPGSPVGVVFGYGAKFPAKYQKALFILDWTFGTMYAIHTKPNGASYTAVKEEFLSRTPLPLTDAAIGPDGALYFTVGGRGTQSELFRVTYVGDESTEPVDAKNTQFAELRAVRKKLEELHTKDAPPSIEFIWHHLAHADRHIRFAARTALEHQPVETWQERALAENDPQTLITAMVALARQGNKKLQPELLERLEQIEFDKLDEQPRLELLRVFALAFTRMGKPNPTITARIARGLDPFYPSKSNDINRELCRLLVYLNSPTVITKTLALMERKYEQDPDSMAELLARNRGYGGTIARILSNQPELQKTSYALMLRNMRYGWTLDQRKKYFKWFDSARTRSGGASYQGFINNIQKEALANVSPAERKALEATVLTPPPKPTELPKPKGPGKKWTLPEVVALSKGIGGRSFANGKRAYAASRCIVCHRFDGDGGATGPDLTNVAGRFSFKDLGESMIDPSKVVSDQYRASKILTVAGMVITGRVTADQDGKLTILVDPEDASKVVELDKEQIEEIAPSKISLMPNDLLNSLNRDEVLDLLAYLMSRGNPDDPIFAK